jgi:hypothetical protein
MALLLCVDGSDPMTKDASVNTLRLVGLTRRIAEGLWTLLGRHGSDDHEPASDPNDPNDPHSLTADALRTPLTSIRSFSEIVHDNPNLSPEERAAFLEIVIQESERLERAIAAVLHEDGEDDKAA